MRSNEIRRALCAIGMLLTLALPAQQPSSGQKIIKDQAEYNAYMAALNTPDAAARAGALEAFVEQYPQSVVLADALEQEMAAWQAAGETAEVKKAAKRLLAIDQGNVRVLGVVVALDRVSAMQGDQAALSEMCLDATGGVREVPMWHKPANMADTDFATLSKLMKAIFVGAEGFCAVEQKNYSQAKDWLAQALEIDSTNAQDTYELARADLETSPQDANGFWYCARAIHLARSAAIPQDASEMAAYCRAKYAAYHGGEDGWDAVLAAVALEDALPRDFAKQIEAAGAAKGK